MSDERQALLELRGQGSRQKGSDLEIFRSLGLCDREAVETIIIPAAIGPRQVKIEGPGYWLRVRDYCPTITTLASSCFFVPTQHGHVTRANDRKWRLYPGFCFPGWFVEGYVEIPASLTGDIILEVGRIPGARPCDTAPLPINRADINRQAAPGLSTDILSYEIAPIFCTSRIDVQLTVEAAAVFNLAVTRSGATTLYPFNKGLALTSGALYDVYFRARTGATYNFQLTTADGVIALLQADESPWSG